MIYVDTSVALSHLLTEERRPPAAFWSETLISSRLLVYELWTKLHSFGLGDSHAEAARTLVARFELLDLESEVLGRALEPFPVPVRTLDALHLASADYLRRSGQAVVIATYDLRFAKAAEAMGFPLYGL